MSARAEGSWLPEEVVEAQAELVDLTRDEIARRMTDLAVAAALAGYVATPRRLLERMLAGGWIADEAWHANLGPELRRVLTERGVETRLATHAPADPEASLG